MGDRFEKFMVLIMAALEVVLIIDLVFKLRKTRKNTEACEKMTGEVKSVTRDGKNMLCDFLVKADNGKCYKISSGSTKALTITEGSTVEILVPEGTVAVMEENEHFEDIIRRGEAALGSLSQAEKARLNEYISQKINNDIDYMKGYMEKKTAVFAWEGMGQKKEIVPLCIFIAVFAVIIAASVILPMMER